MQWYGNEDAGDSESFGRADYSAHINEQRYNEALEAGATKAEAIAYMQGEIELDDITGEDSPDAL